MSLDLNVNNLLKALKQLHFEPMFQKETDQTYILFKIKEVEVPVFFGVNQESALLQIIAYLPYQLHEERLGEVARMLHLVNKQLDLPGFGMDEKEKLMFYRCVVPCLHGKLEEKLLGMYLAAIRLVCETFMFAIGSVAAGMGKLDDIMKNE